jgi:metal-dependent amidase/aminoacylase/carboxypeptidase family protein
MGAEDFAHLLDGCPGCMIRLGVAGPEGCAPLHSGSFAPDETCIAVGVRVLSETLLAWGSAAAAQTS